MSRSVREKNVIYRNLKTAIYYGKSWKKWPKNEPRKLEKNVAAVTADEKKSRKIDDLLWRFQKKCLFKKNRKNYDLLGQLSQKIENSMSRFCTLLALGSTNAPVVLRISP